MSAYDLKGTKLNSLWFYTLKYIILSKASRNPPSGWNYKKFHMTHPDCGGVTTGSWHIHLYSSSTESIPSSMTPQVKHDASIILNATVTGGRPVAAPLALTGNDSRAPFLLELRPNTFHGGGLIPWGAKPFWVLTPNIYSSTKWCVRRLTQEETLYSRDVSHEMVRSLKPKDLATLNADLTFIPARVCKVFLDSLLLKNSMKDQLQTPDGHPACVAWSQDGKAQSAQLHQQGPSANQKRGQQSILAQSPRIPPSTQADSLEWESRLLMEQEQKRMQVATKSDDAEVPEHLWDSRILPNLLQGERSRILRPIRTLALRWWQRNLLREFLKWLKRNISAAW